MGFPTYCKEPGTDVALDFAIDWADWLAAGETITSVTWIVPTGITKDSQVDSATKATIWLSGGTLGTNYDITCYIVTSAQRKDARTITISVRHH